MELIRAAKKKLLQNASIDTAVGDSRVAFRIRDDTNNKIDYYVPDIFHLSWTLQDDINLEICMNDLMNCKRVTDVYKNDGFKAESEHIIMFGNWPIKKIKIVGKVISCECRDLNWVVYIDDGSYEKGNGCLEIHINKYVWATMELEGSSIGLQQGWSIAVYGHVRIIRYDEYQVIIDADRVSITGMKSGEDLLQQIEWWNKVIIQRKKLSFPWVIDMNTQDAMEALRSLEIREENEKKSIPLDCSNHNSNVINLDDDEYEAKVVNSKYGKSLSIDEYATLEFSRPFTENVATPTRLEYVVLKELTKLALQGVSYVSMDSLYRCYSVTIVLNSIVLSGFVESSVSAMEDDHVLANWKATRFTESKKFLLESVVAVLLRRHVIMPLQQQQRGCTATLKEYSLESLSCATGHVKDFLVKAKREGHVAVPFTTVARLLWLHAGSVAVLAVIGALMSSAAYTRDQSGAVVANDDIGEWYLDVSTASLLCNSSHSYLNE